jgi:transcription initiation factor TFIIE subunit beta
MAANYSHATVSDTGADARTNVIFAIERLKEKSPASISTQDLISYVLPIHKREDEAQITRFKQFLKVNSKVQYDPKTDSYSFKPIHSIYNASDLLAFLQAQDTALGIPVRDLKDGWPNVEETIDKLERQHKILVARNKKDNHPRMVWADDSTLVAPLDQEFKDLWHKIPLPSTEDVIKELQRQKFTTAGNVAEPKAAPKAEKKKKKVRRGAKITNIHIQDQFRDYSQQRPQAGK